MTTTTVERNNEARSVTAPPKLYVVWIDTGYEGPDWEANWIAQPYELAEQEAKECLDHGFLSLILPEGETPRSDGNFSNPATDPE